MFCLRRQGSSVGEALLLLLIPRYWNSKVQGAPPPGSLVIRDRLSKGFRRGAVEKAQLVSQLTQPLKYTVGPQVP